MITVVIKEPGKKAYSRQIEDELKVYQEILGGYLESVGFDDKQVLLCNEEGKLKGLEPNLLAPLAVSFIADVIVGPVIVVGTAGEEFRSLTPEEVGKAIERLDNYAIRTEKIK